jgi:hypothetical protein
VLGRRILLLPFLAAQNPGCEHVGQALRFCLSDLVIIKDVPARTCTARELGLGTVEAPNERAAEAAAVAEFDLSDEQQRRLVVQERN